MGGDKEIIDLAPLRWQLPLHLLEGIFLATPIEDKKKDILKLSSKFNGEDEDVVGDVKVIEDQKKMGNKPHLMILDKAAYFETLPKLQNSMISVMARWLIYWLDAVGHVRQCVSGGKDLDIEDVHLYLTTRVLNVDEESKKENGDDGNTKEVNIRLKAMIERLSKEYEFP